MARCNLKGTVFVNSTPQRTNPDGLVDQLAFAGCSAPKNLFRRKPTGWFIELLVEKGHVHTGRLFPAPKCDY